MKKEPARERTIEVKKMEKETTDVKKNKGVKKKEKVKTPEIRSKNKKTNSVVVKKSEAFKIKKGKKKNVLEKKMVNTKNGKYGKNGKNGQERLSKHISRDKNKYKKLMNKDGEHYTKMMKTIRRSNGNMEQSKGYKGQYRDNQSNPKFLGHKRKFSEANQTQIDNDARFKEECEEIMQNENLSQSKKRKLIKELKKKNVKSHYEFDKQLKYLLNKLSQSKEKNAKEKHADEMIRLLETCDIVKYSRTNIGFHVINSLNINAGEKLQKKYGGVFLENMKECCSNVYMSLTFQSFYKYGNKELKTEMERWLLENSQSLFTKFGSRLWNGIFKMAKKKFQGKMVNSLLIPKTKEFKKVDATSLNRSTADLYKDLNDAYKEKVKTRIMDLLDTAVNKELLYNSVIHQLINFACTISNDTELTNLMDTIHEGCEYLITSEAGNKALILLLGFSTNKQKKSFLKIVKTNIVDLCKNCINYLLIIRLLKITDDTKVLNQLVVKKITENIEDVLNNEYGYYVIMSFFYNFHEKNKDASLPVVYKEVIYAAAPKSVKDPVKRKNEILESVVKSLSDIFKDPDKLSNYIKQKKYVFLIIEFLLNTGCSVVLGNLLTIFLQLVPFFKEKTNMENSTNSTEMEKEKRGKKEKKKKHTAKLLSEQDEINYKVSNICLLFRKLTKEDTIDFFKKVINEKTLYSALCEFFLSNLKMVLSTRLVCFFVSLLKYVKQSDNSLFKKVIKQAKEEDTNKIYNDLKKRNISVNKLEEYMQLLE